MLRSENTFMYPSHESLFLALLFTFSPSLL
jgi:hypothetical protein